MSAFMARLVQILSEIYLGWVHRATPPPKVGRCSARPNDRNRTTMNLSHPVTPLNGSYSRITPRRDQATAVTDTRVMSPLTSHMNKTDIATKRARAG